MASILRLALRPPIGSEIPAALGRARAEWEAEGETPRRALEREIEGAILLRHQPGSSGEAGREPTRSRTGFMVVSSGHPPEVVLAALQGIERAPPEEEWQPLSDTLASLPSPPAPRVQVVRSWVGEGWWIPIPDDPHSAVIARLLETRLARLPGRAEGRIALREHAEGAVLLIVGTAWGTDVRGMRSWVHGSLPALRDSTSTPAVLAAVGEEEERLRFLARSSEGWTALEGSHRQPASGSGGLEAYLRRLRSVTPESLRTFLSGITEVERRAFGPGAPPR